MPVKIFQQTIFCENIIEPGKICQNVFYWNTLASNSNSIKIFFKICQIKMNIKNNGKEWLKMPLLAHII
jgi:hypothetical protein